ncbi:hypothetical protein [Saccharopolyspora sp. 6M]|uniref:hypothetical protein n=1 Tax=Saccharopolyspora sp. 6M TaxID=2877237 RepID=UPI001CD28CBC|nr:hypothetical protein [Saccharopolyspora sp. 6M]MCA1228449.1 hypothetical protein [Saccharopolyspora sp. 6M]
MPSRFYADSGFLAPARVDVGSAAVEQGLSATTREVPVLNGVLFECGPGSVPVAAPDRYRLATRTLRPGEPAVGGWSATVHADDLRSAMPGSCQSRRIAITVARNGFRMVLDGAVEQRCRLLADPFPDYRAMLDALPAVTTRVAVEKVLSSVRWRRAPPNNCHRRSAVAGSR